MTVLDLASAHPQEANMSEDSGWIGGAAYRELFPIGKGGFADISIAISRGIGGFSKLVVLKALREELSADPVAAEMFMGEARLSARMNHPNVVQVYEVFLRRQIPVIVMEYVDGQSLGVIFSKPHGRASVSLDLTISILTKVLAGLHYAHSLCDFSGDPLGLIHRDVSPQNVMLTYDGQVKLLDFGIAKLANAAQQTNTGIVKGKLAYMAPEQFCGNTDRRSDIFSVGVMLWELAARRRFWRAMSEPEMIRCLVSGDIPHLHVEADIDPQIHEICKRAIAPDANNRYPTAAAMLEDLERLQAKRGVLASQAAIGEFVTTLCVDARDQIHRAIREHLSTIDLSQVRMIDGVTPANSRERTARSSINDAVPRSKTAQALQFCARRPLWAALAGLGALAVLVLFVVLGSGVARAVSPATSRVPALEQQRATPPSEALVRVRANAEPAAARWYVDERKVDSNLLDMSVPRDDNTVHTLRAEADGYEPVIKSFRFGANVELAVVLQRKHAEVMEQEVASAQLSNQQAKSHTTQRGTSAMSHRTVAAASAARQPVASRTADSPPPPPKEEQPSTVQFGANLKRVRVNSARRSIEADYPGG